MMSPLGTLTEVGASGGMPLFTGSVLECPAELYRALRRLMNERNEEQMAEQGILPTAKMGNIDAGPDPRPGMGPYDME